MSIRVAICEDDKRYLLALVETLRTDPGLDLVATARDARTALGLVAEVDVWLVDIRLPGMQGTDLAAELRRADANTKVILMTSFPAGYVLDSLHDGVRGFLHKDTPLAAVPAAIRSVHAGLRVGTDVVYETLRRHMESLIVVDPERYERLVGDERDAQLLQLMRRSASIPDMAAQIQLSVPGAKKRLTKMFRCAGVSNQQELLNWLYDPTCGPAHLAGEPTPALC
ncbi:MAG: response regulator transcription factor [Tessaracoccus sp.]|uniref:response regulator n=1 Tax=Tessaracoccus sp. TaxID=1971211 RepID=UPI001EC25E68|nr:response regulator transcription factor [Tessaracoccus sp.]MBK7821169.1 response regulator transcription factor [Tessaracoccus sp.]